MMKRMISLKPAKRKPKRSLEKAKKATGIIEDAEKKITTN